MRGQDSWGEHAAFMNDLARDGFVVLGGPLGDERVLLIVDADDEESVRARLAADPWTPMHLLVIQSVDRWEILLDHAAG
jgi:hypothetical protein